VTAVNPVELATETEGAGSEDVVEECDVTLIKLIRFKESPIGTLMKRETILKLTIISLGWYQKVPKCANKILRIPQVMWGITQMWSQ
jgi:hypothetical protein